MYSDDLRRHYGGFHFTGNLFQSRERKTAILQPWHSCLFYWSFWCNGLSFSYSEKKNLMVWNPREREFFAFLRITFLSSAACKLTNLLSLQLNRIFLNETNLDFQLQDFNFSFQFVSLLTVVWYNRKDKMLAVTSNCIPNSQWCYFPVLQ